MISCVKTSVCWSWQSNVNTVFSVIDLPQNIFRQGYIEPTQIINENRPFKQFKGVKNFFVKIKPVVLSYYKYNNLTPFTTTGKQKMPWVNYIRDVARIWRDLISVRHRVRVSKSNVTFSNSLTFRLYIVAGWTGHHVAHMGHTLYSRRTVYLLLDGKINQSIKGRFLDNGVCRIHGFVSGINVFLKDGKTSKTIHIQEFLQLRKGITTSRKYIVWFVKFTFCVSVQLPRV